MSLIIIMLLAFTALNAENNAYSVTFFEGDFISAKAKAGEEGKLFFVDFYAKWCTPCRWMEESTFKDKEVVELLRENYIAMKIDIDDIDGYTIKQKYQVHILPTILIFNSKGELVERIEETVASRKMAEVLKYHNREENKVRIQRALNSSPRKSIEMEASAFTKITKTKTKSQVAPTSVSLKNIYRIQLGVYNEFENTYDLVNKMKSQFIEPIIVLNDMSNDKIVYKVMMGSFQTESEAIDFKNILETDFNIKGIVK